MNQRDQFNRGRGDRQRGDEQQDRERMRSSMRARHASARGPSSTSWRAANALIWTALSTLRRSCMPVRNDTCEEVGEGSEGMGARARGSP